MNSNTISVRYARALFASAKEQNVLDSVRKDMDTILAVSTESPELGKLLNSPVTKPSVKIKALTGVFSDSHMLTKRFLELLTTNKRESWLPLIARNFISFYKKEKNIVSVSISSAIPMPESMQSQLKSKLKADLKSEVEMESDTDESLIGGFVITIENQMLDASVKGQLKKIRYEFLNSKSI